METQNALRIQAEYLQTESKNRSPKIATKTQASVVALALLAALYLGLASLPAQAQGVGYLYDNGPAASNDGGPARISGGLQISDGFTTANNGYTHYAYGFMFAAWVENWDSVGCVKWSFDSTYFGTGTGNTNYSHGTACPGGAPGADLSSVYLFQRISSSIKWDVYQVTVSTPRFKLPSGTMVYLTLQGNSKANYVQYWDSDNAVGALGNNSTGGGVPNPVAACVSPGGKCPNLTASQSFTIIGTDQ